MTHQYTFYLKTFGCAMNYADSEKIHRILLQSGCRKVLDPAWADIVIANTCSVRQKGEDKVFGFVREVKRAAAGQNREVLVGITGCMTRKTGIAKRFLFDEIEGAKYCAPTAWFAWFDNHSDPLFGRSDRIDFVFRIEETGHLTKILSLITKTDIGNDEKWEEYLKIKQVRDDPASASVIIQTGCDNFCSFCIVPYARGREISRPKDEIVAEVRELAKAWVREVTLLGQNVNSYGKETKAKLWNTEALTWNAHVSREKTPFRELLDELGNIEGIDRIRFTSSNPHDMTRDVLDAHFEIPSLCPHLHFALQSGSDRILKAMNRKHTYSDFKAQLDYLRSRDPLFSVSTDIIVGFPGETEEDFALTEKALLECGFDFVYISRYSSRSGTFATKNLADDVSPEEKALRWSRLNILLEESVQKRNSLMVGRTEAVLVTEKKESGAFSGRTRNFKEVVFDWPAEIGEIVRVKITGIAGWSLNGNLNSA